MLERLKEDDEKQVDERDISRRGTRRKQRRHSGKISWKVKLGGTLLLSFLALVAGLGVGYVGLGHGSLRAVFDFQTYKHMYDLVFKLT